MNITKYSRNRVYENLNKWDIPRDYADPMFNYFVLGLPPGSFFTAVLADSFMDAMSRSHPANNVLALKHVVGWIRSTMLYDIAWGSYEVVDRWLAMSDVERRTILEQRKIIFTEQEEIMLALNNARSVEPVFLD